MQLIAVDIIDAWPPRFQGFANVQESNSPQIVATATRSNSKVSSDRIAAADKGGAGLFRSAFAKHSRTGQNVCEDQGLHVTAV